MRPVPPLLCGVMALAAPAFAADAGSRLTCEQIYAVAQTSVRYRDQGHALSQVLAALDGDAIRNKLDGAQFALLRNAVSVVYLGNATPEEVALECMRIQGRD